MAVRIIGANDRRTKLELELPFAEDGDWAFDEDGDPIKGRTPVTITLPMFNFMSYDDFKTMQDTLAEIEARTDIDESAKGREVVLSTLRPHVNDVVYDLIAGRSLGELQQISTEWGRRSSMPVGELSASNGSSKNTRRQSSSTSSATASASET